MTEFDGMLTDFDVLDGTLPADTGVEAVDIADTAPIAETEVWSADVWLEFETVEADVAGTTIVLPDPFQPATGFSAGAALGGYLARRRARRAARTAPAT